MSLPCAKEEESKLVPWSQLGPEVVERWAQFQSLLWLAQPRLGFLSSSEHSSQASLKQAPSWSDRKGAPP